MLQLLCHLWGDYMLQNHQMARQKTQSFNWALLHAVLYTLPFVLVYGVNWHAVLLWLDGLDISLVRNQQGWRAMAWICWTHLAIDRFALARRIVHWYGHGEPGRLWWRWVGGGAPYLQTDPLGSTRENVAYSAHRAPEWLAGWLRIIVDNTLHLTINYVALRWAGLSS